MTDEDMQKIRTLIREELKLELAQHCKFGDVDEGEARDAIRMISSLDPEGGLSGGMEVIKENHKWIKNQRDLGKKAGLVVAGILLTTVVTALLAATWKGIQATLTNVH